MIEERNYKVTFLEWCKQFTCVLICLLTLLSSMSEAFAAGKDYKKTDSEGGATYYISDGQDFKKLFDFTLGDIPDILNWILDFKTYTVIKEYTNNDGDTVYKGYFNTPNLQSIVKNEIIGMISDGYTDNTYNVDETEKVVSVGKNATSVNAITRYGFAIPSYTYMGEYPKEVMSPAGIIPNPKKWWEVMWRAIQALFGVSFLQAPDAESFNSIKYMNHGYKDRSDYILEYFKQYYLKYFEDKIPVDEALSLTDSGAADGIKPYFSGPEEVLDLTVTEKAKKAAEKYVEKYEEEYLSALQHYIWWYKYVDNGNSTVGLSSTDWFSDYRTSLTLDPLDPNDEEDMATWYSSGILHSLFTDSKWKLVDDEQKVDINKNIYGTDKSHPVDGWHYFAGREAFKRTFYPWLIDNLETAYIIADSIGSNVKRNYYGNGKEYSKDGKTTSSEFSSASDYGLNPSSGTFNKGTNEDLLVALAADMIRYSYDYIMTHIKYDNQERKEHRDAVSYEITETPHTFIKYMVYYKDSAGNITDNDDGWYTIDNQTISYNSGDGHWYTGFTGSYTAANLDDAANHASWESGSYDEASDGNWHTTSVSDDDRLYKDVESWISNPTGYTEPGDTPDSDPIKGSDTIGSTTEYTKDERSYDCASNITDNIYWNNGFNINFQNIDWSNVHHIDILELSSYTTVKKVEHKRTDTRIHYRKANFKFESLWNGKGDYNSTTYKITNLSDYVDGFLKAFDFDRYNIKVKQNDNTMDNFNEDDLVHPDLQSIYNNYGQNVKLIQKYRKFNRYMARGTYDNSTTSNSLSDLSYIPYRQCLIYNTGDEHECKSQKYGNEDTTITTANVVVYSGIYKITAEYRENDYSGSYETLSYEDAHTLLTQLKIYCGSYYDDVLTNMMKLMAAAAEKDGDMGPTTMIVEDDPRVMPYDTATMIPADRRNYTIVDPRVTIYKDHIIGGIVSSFSLNWGFGIFIKPQKTIINIAGKITEISIFLQSICNFDFLDSIGLSPTKFWGEGTFVTLIMIAITLYFIVNTVIAIIKMGSRSAGKIIAGFLILALELGAITCVAANPNNIWTTIKNANNKLTSFGEMSISSTYPELNYLFGGAEDGEVLYYLPYLDCWSKYNTGYGLMEDEQLIDDTNDYRELIDFYNPQIDGKDIRHWSILLIDSFEYHGRSNSIVNTVEEGGIIINGNTINNNAYRVVDHFLAPRIDITSGSDLHLTVKQNENYNHEFQSGVADVITKLANCCLGCFLSIIKLMIFLYFWWQLYMFIFNVVLGLGTQKKKFSTILMETFMPLLTLTLFGLYAGICLVVGMEMTGLIGLIIILFMFWLTIIIVKWWHDKSKNTFPFTLNWLYFLATMNVGGRASSMSAELHDRQDNTVGGFEDWKEGTKIKDENDKRDRLERQTDFLFNDDGTMRKDRIADFNNKEGAQQQVIDWYNQEKAAKYTGRMLSQKELQAMKEFESNEYFKKYKSKADDQYRHYGQLSNVKKKSKSNSSKSSSPESLSDEELEQALAKKKAKGIKKKTRKIKNSNEEDV